MKIEKGINGATLLGEPLPVELMNTVSVDRAGVHDALDNNAAAAGWLRKVAGRIGVEPERLDDDAVRDIVGDLRSLRDALRRLAAEVTGDPRPPATAPGLTRPDAIGVINSLAQVWPELVWHGDRQPCRSYRASGTATDLAVRLIAHKGVELLGGEDRDRLRPCLAPNCLLFFVKDHPRREWCSPACGNRARVNRHYHRQQTGARTPTDRVNPTRT